MKKAEVQLPDGLYQQVEGLAGQLHVSVPDLLRQAAEQMLAARPKIATPPGRTAWKFPEARRLGAFQTPADDWRLLANEDAA